MVVSPCTTFTLPEKVASFFLSRISSEAASIWIGWSRFCENLRVTQKDQVVTGETAVFDTKTNLITMLGGVVLTQCKNVLRGDRLLVDMTTGRFADRVR